MLTVGCLVVSIAIVMLVIAFIFILPRAFG